ncbi:hypothetical protein [Rhizobium leguminosarum]|uniref:hypothetical protein n=1 Tax=Rhizobium leguminosarum TaxID=384 RepID=UPI001441EC2E|nr:hypothetical protein [Rhizobium leguminosarum]NKK96743.1 hypothetical protein [Rhizobium leguminosarum bv. viciae]NKL75537.1 hypothetical protein [Rhizobium leguminosarum bv. viciae]
MTVRNDKTLGGVAISDDEPAVPVSAASPAEGAFGKAGEASEDCVRLPASASAVVNGWVRTKI